MKLVDFDFDLPKHLIAQIPSRTRDSARLMILDRSNGMISHDVFRNIAKYIKPGDEMVFNDTKVMPVRIVGKKESGGKVEVLLLPPNLRNYMGKNIGAAKKIIFEGGLVGEIKNNQINFDVNNTVLLAYLDKYGQVPYPPYIKIDRSLVNRSLEKRYQTIYAKNSGSAAAPTAGFHFSRKLIKRSRDEGIKLNYLTLHVGLGTFAPVKTPEIESHKIHTEFFQIPTETVSSVQYAVSKKRRVIAVGTTTVRTLETWARTGQTTGETDIYIYPGFKFKVVQAMVTNFHMPRSSLVLLVAAFAGRKFILEAYNLAVKMGYRFGSFGDGMVIV